MKCAGTHRTADCQKSLDTPPKCVNCGGQHTANYGQCSALQIYLEKRNKKVKTNNGVAFGASAFPSLNQTAKAMPSPMSRPTPPLPSVIRPYADVVAGGSRGPSVVPSLPPRHMASYTQEPQELHANGVNTMLDLFGAIKELNSMVDLAQMLSLTRTLINKLRPCRTVAEKFQVFCSVLRCIE